MGKEIDRTCDNDRRFDRFAAFMEGESSQPAALDELMKRLDRGDFDLVAIGRALLQDPLWAQKIHAGRTAELMSFNSAAFGTLT